MNKGVILRADGSKEIGMGHLARAILINEHLLHVYNIKTTLILKEDRNAEMFLKNRITNYKAFPKSLNKKQELAFIIKHINETKTGLLILDILELDLDYEYTNELKKLVPLVAITDDSNKRIINADAILNGNPCQLGKDYTKENAQYYIGPSYFIMDKRYGKMNFIHKKNEITKILLTIGGSDHNNLIFKILDAVNKLTKKYSITLITSSGTGYIKKLKKRLELIQQSVILKIDTDGIFQDLKECDFAITAGGNTLFERIAARKPGITICQLKRQMEIADKFAELNLNRNLGFGPELSTLDIETKLALYLENKHDHEVQYKTAPQYLDGKGLERATDIFLNLINRA